MIAGHTHDFTEVLYDNKDGTELRCRCGARLWEPPAAQIVERLAVQSPGTPEFTEGLVEAFRDEAHKAVEQADAAGVPVAGVQTRDKTDG